MGQLSVLKSCPARKVYMLIPSGAVYEREG